MEATFSMIKRVFGDSVRSKTETARKNEVLLKVLCHNIRVLVHEMHGLGITPQFPQLGSCGTWSAGVSPTGDDQSLADAATTGEPGALLRGGFGPSSSSDRVGFRCAR